MINCDNAEVFAECAITHEEVEVCSCGPAVQQNKCGCSNGAFHLSIEGVAATRKMNVMTGGQVGNDVFAQLSTFTMVTETFAPFSRVTETSSPAL